MYRKVLAPDVDVLVFLYRWIVFRIQSKEAIESVDPKEQGLPASNP